MGGGFSKRTYDITPSTKKTEITGEWFAVVCKGKQKATLPRAIVNKWFLEYQNGKIDKVLLICLKPGVGLEFHRISE